MSNGNVRTGAATSTAEGAQQLSSAEDVRVYRLGAALGVLDLAMSGTYPDVLVPDTITEIAQNSSDPVAASDAARAANNLRLIQGTVEKPEWN
ncbi:MAG: hypothetical protein ABWY71_03525 [Candidatus Saccharimonadales bacterium]